MSTKPSTPAPYKPEPITGYTEWLPEVRLVELRWLDHIRSVFESYGFCNIETPAVEEIEVLSAKGGDTEKEIYALRRLYESPNDAEPRVALHYDLTVPMARYVAQHYNDLVFPFKRYQMQKVWRGERPQEGRYREFLQCDIDVIDNEDVSMSFDAELPIIVYEIFQGLGVGPFSINVNNRKILQGFYQGLGIEQVTEAIRIADKFDKIGADGVLKSLVEQLNIPADVAAKCVALAQIRTGDSSFVERVRALGVQSELLETGLTELQFVIDHMKDIPAGHIWADLSIARGLDYYTGTVYECKLLDYPGYPSVCSGGRYENLVGAYLRKKLPGVGLSIGLTRIFAKLLKDGKLPVAAKSGTQLLVVYPQGADRDAVRRIAAHYRAKGVKVEMYHEDKKTPKQLQYAVRKGIPYVLFPGADGAPHQVKNLATGEQVEVTADWLPG
ncbi:histidine--tRNA ligase [Piscinibacter gummiphilus]|jgi:histidyl-tRNA synthetase|uniref:Histidine--tRNA ligase n=1 Tax=Piscinibacter gummiphilus TaxID=946333 RepID=A0A1W6L4Y8_9BURK|nr:histidine--tRNA ligase [Piscinibacter gummiphilus]ARN19399.1 histidine--tRNA ligase [Piscinibacter gummiphilus]ATU64066.1 histidine--tRNA ligase [Piscinibacter gummiphilus]GLS92970.1 histidine--tRNA ligase [Piscinibacter gummiphilus]